MAALASLVNHRFKLFNQTFFFAVVWEREKFHLFFHHRTIFFNLLGKQFPFSPVRQSIAACLLGDPLCVEGSTKSLQNDPILLDSYHHHRVEN